MWDRRLLTSFIRPDSLLEKGNNIGANMFAYFLYYALLLQIPRICRLNKNVYGSNEPNSNIDK